MPAMTAANVDSSIRGLPMPHNSLEGSRAETIRTWGRAEDPAGQFRLFAVRSPRGAPRPTPTEEPGQ